MPEDSFRVVHLNNPLRPSIYQHLYGGQTDLEHGGIMGGNRRHHGFLALGLPGQAAFIARWYILHWAAGYEQANWFMWDNHEWGNSSVHTVSGQDMRADTSPG